jgi:hypothetical protein
MPAIKSLPGFATPPQEGGSIETDFAGTLYHR